MTIVIGLFVFWFLVFGYMAVYGACFLRLCVQVRIFVLLNSDISFKTDRINATALLEKQEGCGAEKLSTGSVRNPARLASIPLKQVGVTVPSHTEPSLYWFVSYAAVCLIYGLT